MMETTTTAATTSSNNNNKQQPTNSYSDNDSGDDDHDDEDHDAFIDDLPASVARRKNRRVGNGAATTSSSTVTVTDIRRRYSKTPLIAICIVGIFVIAAVLRGTKNNNKSASSQSQSQQNAQQNAGVPLLHTTAHKEHHYTNPYEASASGDGREHAVKVINEKSTTGHVASHGGWNEQDEEHNNNIENESDWSCKTDFPNELAWINWMHKVERLGPQSACVRELKHPCHCRQPLDAIPRSSSLWKQCVQRNQDLLSQEVVSASSSSSTSPQQQQQQLDVLLLGDSIIEYWQGTKMGVTMPELQPTHQVYLNLFRQHHNNNANNNNGEENEYVNTAPVHGLALGIAGDTCPQLLYRLQHGELPSTSLQQPPPLPHVYWILIGMNDYLMNACNAHVIAACNIKVVQHIQQQHHRATNGASNATVVINSMLPVGVHSHAAWREWSQINQQLECYAREHQYEQGGVYFFNAYEHFVSTSTTTTNNNNNNDADSSSATKPALTTVINTTLLQPDGLHPSTLGYQVWGNAIVEYVQELKHLKKIASAASAGAGGTTTGSDGAPGGGP